MKKISIVIPTYNEEENVVPLTDAIIKEMADSLPGYDYEVIFIDNDSKDSTRDKLRYLCSEHPKVKAIFNAKNYGQFNSPFYGVLQSTGDATILMCADFQDPVDMIPKYVKAWEDGAKIALGQKSSSDESGLVYRARGFYYNFIKKHSSVEFYKQVTGSGLYDRKFVEVLKTLEDPQPFIRGIVAEMGYGVVLVPFNQPKRRAGKSSNNFFRYYDAAAQSLASYTKIGVRLCMGAGIVSTIASLGTAVAMGIYKLLNWNTFSVQPYLFSLVLFIIVSLQLAFTGVIGEYVLNINTNVRKRPLVIEAERLNFGENDTE